MNFYEQPQPYFNLYHLVVHPSGLVKEQRVGFLTDLVLLDIMVPGLDGFEVLNLIRQRSNVPVLVVTAKRDVPSLNSALTKGADDYIRKPFSSREIVARKTQAR
jgi:DNA-binding response OmpR family regulator